MLLGGRLGEQPACHGLGAVEVNRRLGLSHDRYDLASSHGRRHELDAKTV
ncbi:hypothetical protein GCM10010172_30320 [Paractinoplanes ferrugineus]|uniref:Uncharacterized protein n=1 Tax=Paractinoplanes ferrugineus TaxID=113564 RepID=A0A919J3T2_9ACTN|nr:hypothetical protein [Actinoplanes ferrugineus]GIE14276.1 hypothetical protein Afe05nite_61160 [Actinoplanes ferrugineus]